MTDPEDDFGPVPGGEPSPAEAAALAEAEREAKAAAEAARRPSKRLPAVAPDRSPPHSQEAEEHVLATILLDEGQTLQRAVIAGIAPESFYFPRNRLLYEICLDLHGRGQPVQLETLAEELKTRRQLEIVGGFAYLVQVTAKIPTTAHAGYFIEKVREKAVLREAIKVHTAAVEAAYGFTGGLDEYLSEARFRLAALTPSDHRKATPVKPITSFQYPSDDDANMLLGSDDYLGRGGGLLFVSHAGAGKSSWAMDACMMWALGRAWMGIKSHRPRKTLIIQAEDSDRYIGKIFASFAYVNKLTEAELTTLSENCVIVRLKGVSGPAFFSELKAMTALHKPDLVVINPIYLYAEGDITRSEFAQPFLLGLDEANKDEKFAYILIHHTGKPQAKGNNGKRAEVEDWESAYMGFGSSYLANWPRATILLEPVAGHPGKYQIKLGKGGFNAGITRTVEQGAGTRQEPVTRIAIKHSTERMEVNGKDRPVYYWEVDTEPAEIAPEPKSTTKPTKYAFNDYRSLFPESKSNGLTLGQLHRALLDNGEIKKNILHQVCKRWADDGDVEIIDVHGQPRRYRAAF